MWFKLATADFSSKNLGTMADIAGSWGVSYSLQGGISKNNCPTIVKMNNDKTQAAADFTATFTLADGATLTSITATLKSSGAQLAQETSNTSITIAAAKITGDIIITAIASGSSTGGGGSEGGGESTDPTPGGTTTLTPHSTQTGFYINSSTKFAAESSSSVVIYAVQPNTLYSFSVEKKSTGSASNANLIFVPVKSLSGVSVGGSPDFATGYNARVVEMSTNETNVLDYAFTTPADCNYIIFSNHKSDSTHTVTTNASGSSTPEVEGTDVALTKAVDGVYLGPTATYTSDGTSQVLCYAVSPNKTYTIGAPLDSSKKLVVCCVKSIDNIAAGNTATFATGWSDRQIGEAGVNLTITTPADCTHLVFSNYQKNQAPSYVKLVN